MSRGEIGTCSPMKKKGGLVNVVGIDLSRKMKKIFVLCVEVMRSKIVSNKGNLNIYNPMAVWDNMYIS
jgi:hypothetical protein